MSKMTLQRCPTAETMARYLAGSVPASDYDEISAHVERCSVCQQALDTIAPDSDTLLVNLRRVAAVTPNASGPVLEQMLTAVAAIGLTPLFQRPGDAATQDVGPAPIRGYRLLEKLGQGAMGEVYKALHVHLNRIVALKLLIPERVSQSGIARFQREMRAVGLLDHPHVVRALDAGVEDGRHYLVMEYVAGSDVGRLVREHGTLPIADACEIVRQAAVGLQHAHEHQLVHRDLKPSNLILDLDGRVKILDLGLALLSEPETDGELTGTGYVMGTADYLAPEQAGDSHRVDIRADIYSLGCTLFKLLTGTAPFAGLEYQTAIQKMLAHGNRPIPNVRQLRAEVPVELARELERMLAKQPADRHASPAKLSDTLAPFCAGANLQGLHRDRVQDHANPGVDAAQCTPATPEAVPVAAAPAGFGGQREAPLTSSGPGATTLRTEARPLVSGNRAWLPPGWRLPAVAAAAAALFVLALGILLFLRTPHGEVIVELGQEVDPQDVKLEVSGNGELHVVDVKQGWAIDVAQGQYNVKLSAGEDRFQLDRDTVTVSRNGSERVRVTLRAQTGTTAPDPVAAVPSENLKSKDGIITLDHLDAARIPESERFDWQPAALVAVIGEHRLRVWGPVKSAVFHPSGAYFVAGDLFSTSTLELCPAETLKDFADWHVTSGQPFSPSGDKLASLGGVAWLDPQAPPDRPRISRSQPIPSPSARPTHGEYFNVAWLREDFLAVTTGERGVIEIWDTSGGALRLHHTLRFDSGELFTHHVASSADGTRLIACTWNDGGRSLFAWDVDWTTPNQPVFQQRFDFQAPEALGRVLLSPDGTTAFAAQPMGVQVYDLSGTVPVPGEVLNGLHEPTSLSRDGRFLAGQEGGAVPVVYERRGGQYVRTQLNADVSGVVSLAVSSDSSRLVVGTRSGRIRIYDLTTTPPGELQPPLPGSHPQDVGFSADGRYLTLDGYDQSSLWDLTGDLPRQKCLSGFGFDGTTSIVNQRVLFRGRELWDLSCDPANRLGDLSFNGFLAPDGSDAVWQWSDHGILRHPWKTTPRGKFVVREAVKFNEFRDAEEVCWSAWRPDIGRMVTVSKENELHIWQLDNTNIPRFTIKTNLKYGADFNRVHLSNDGQLLAAYQVNGLRLHVWDLTDPRLEHYESNVNYYMVDLVFDLSSRLAVISDSSGVSVHDWVQGRVVRNLKFGPLRTPDRPTTSIALHPDGRHVAVTNTNCTTYILRIPELAHEARAEPR